MARVYIRPKTACALGGAKAAVIASCAHQSAAAALQRGVTPGSHLRFSLPRAPPPTLEDSASRGGRTASGLEHSASRPEHTASRLEHTASRLEHSASGPEHTASRLEHSASGPEHSGSRAGHRRSLPRSSNPLIVLDLRARVCRRSCSGCTADGRVRSESADWRGRLRQPRHSQRGTRRRAASPPFRPRPSDPLPASSARCTSRGPNRINGRSLHRRPHSRRRAASHGTLEHELAQDPTLCMYLFTSSASLTSPRRTWVKIT